jgi:hypothetical protein
VAAELALRVTPAAGGGPRPARGAHDGGGARPAASTARWLRRAERERGENSGAGIAEEGMASAPRSRYMASEVGGLASKDSEEEK